MSNIIIYHILAVSLPFLDMVLCHLLCRIVFLYLYLHLIRTQLDQTYCTCPASYFSNFLKNQFVSLRNIPIAFSTSELQFGFKARLSTELCTDIVKNKYIKNGSIFLMP